MQNDHDKMNQDETEYHFSDEEANYEIEPETKPDVAEREPRVSMLNRLSQSKRMLIAGAIFLALIFVVYKMVSPTSVTPTTDIAPVNPANVPAPPAANTAAVVPSTAPSVPPQQAAPVSPNLPPPGGQVIQPSVSQPPITTTTSPAPGTTPPGMPAVIPVQTAPTATPAATVDTQIAAAQANSERLIAQMEADYSQKLTDMTNQNKAMQDQMQSLNTRVGNIEGQLTKLIQTLSSQIERNNTPVPVQQASDGRVSYNVQAIIPGRAWLKSDSGETVTVAEGDMVKNIGRVTKIDPYDGVVEISTGTKVISLSYGNGA
jgi:hypothetical protein